MPRYATLLAVVLLAVLLTLHCAESQKGSCFRKYSVKKGCKAKERDKGRVTFDDCCRGKTDGGWTAPKQSKKSCQPCVKIQTVTSFWTSWGPWSKCNATCGVAFRNRTRVCKSSGQPSCKGKAKDRERCTVPPCPIHGGWSTWSAWTPCSVTCEKGVRFQKRICDNPAPQHGGKECKGSLEKVDSCQINAHCPIDGGWGEWGQWSSCSKTCDIGKKKREHKCDNPKPQYGGKPCNKSEATDIYYCREEKCDESGGDSSGSGGWGSGSGESGGEPGEEWEGSGESSGSGSGSGSGWFFSGSGSSGDSPSDQASRLRRRKRHYFKLPDDE